MTTPARAARDCNGLVHLTERYRLGEDAFDTLTLCARTVASIEFPLPDARGYAWVDGDAPITCIVCLGGSACTST